MKNIHALNKLNSYFEGWYLKHQINDNTIVFIPAYHINRLGKRGVSIQIITNNLSKSIHFSLSDFKVKKNRFWIKIGNNLFSEKGIYIDINTKGLVIKGNLRYTPFTPLKYNAMGPFALIPFMQCNHGILSLTHQLTGKIVVNNEIINYTGGTGYIEKDWGSSFPNSYFWTQCNWHEKDNCCLMLSLADIPLFCTNFTGCICIIYFMGKEYRLATYLGVKISKYNNEEVILQQGELQLQVKLIERNAFKIQAPVEGAMTRTVHESPVCKVKYKFICKNNVLFDFISNNASYEFD